MTLLSILVFILILGVIVLVHEFGHFIWARKFGVHIYEFSIGMGPVLFTHEGKDKIKYRIRLLPIGGFVQMAGEVYEDDDKVNKKDFLCNKPWHQRIIIIVAGVINNFILAVILLFFYALIWGAPTNNPVIEDFSNYITITDENNNEVLKETGFKVGDRLYKVDDTYIDLDKHSDLSYYIADKDRVTIYVDRNNESKKIVINNEESIIDSVITDIPLTPAEEGGLKKGDKILKINNHKVKYSDDISLYIQMYAKDKKTNFTVKRDGKVINVKVKPEAYEISKTKAYRIGILTDGKVEKGFLASLKYAFVGFDAMLRQMAITLKGLFTGSLSLKQLSGPVGVYQVVDAGLAAGISYLIYLTAFLSLNVGFINILPLPAFDGGRAFFMIIEKIRRKPINSKIENTIHAVGFILLLILMLFITWQDIWRIFS